MLRYVYVMSATILFFGSLSAKDQGDRASQNASDLDAAVSEMQKTEQRVADLVASAKFDYSDVKEVIRRDQFLHQVGVRSGISKYELRTPNYFVKGHCFTINVELRDSGTISGPKAKEIRSSFSEYLEVLRSTIARDEQILRAETRESSVQSSHVYPEGLNVYVRPETNNSVLKKAYAQLFRDADALPGGTAAALLKEVWGDAELRHLKKAEGMVRHLKDHRKAVQLSKEDRNTLQMVIQDLDYALTQAYIREGVGFITLESDTDSDSD